MSRERSHGRRGRSLVRRRDGRSTGFQRFARKIGEHKRQYRVDWRSMLHSVFVGNISRNVKKKDLWDWFNRFGRVVDVYIPKSARLRAGESSAFAFVRYKLERDAHRAIEVGNGSLFGNRRVVVSLAKYSWRNRKGASMEVVNYNNSSKGEVRRERNAFTDGRSYKEVVEGKNSTQRNTNCNLDVPLESGSVPVENRGTSLEQSKEGLKTIVLHTDIPTKDMEWLNFSLVGKVKAGISCNVIQDALCQKELSVVVSPFNEDNLLLTFSSTVGDTLDDVSSAMTPSLVPETLEPADAINEPIIDAAPVSRAEEFVSVDSFSACENEQNVGMINNSSRAGQQFFNDTQKGDDVELGDVGHQLDLGLDDYSSPRAQGEVLRDPGWAKPNKGKKGNRFPILRSKKKDKKKSKACGQNSRFGSRNSKIDSGANLCNKSGGCGIGGTGSDSEAENDWVTASQAGLVFKDKDVVLERFKKFKSVQDSWLRADLVHNLEASISVMLKELKFDLKNWKKAHCNRGMSEIKETKDEIQKLEEEWAADLSNERLRKEIILKKEELWKSYKVEERSWHQKSRFQWLQEGDRNSKFYHLVAADRYRSNSLECIDVGGSVLTDPVEVKEAIAAYFEEFYSRNECCLVEDVVGNFVQLSN
ncbi:hypothetical protein COLO4_36277 [Corchorus olitorius]|uniref:RRM domain-containing protein n=1 Tax=Corchorus olitorius TaxID=93759 RepID=A0A1R3GA54_9ROSI|nr:hypothetical protein COLO4_36277 [Corchorus olitorius]